MRAKNMRLGIGFLLPLAGALCMPGCSAPCCPTGAVFTSQDEWVCPSNCPGGGKTTLSYQVQFTDGGRACDPGDDFTVAIHNLTDGVELPPLTLDNPGIGLYEDEIAIVQDHDTTYRVEASSGDSRCGEVTAELTVETVDPGDSHRISLSGLLDPPNCTLQGGFVPIGADVKIDYVQNLTDFALRVDKGTASELTQPNGQGFGLRGLDATGTWALGLSDFAECAEYANLPGDAQVLGIDVFLQCDCPMAP